MLYPQQNRCRQRHELAGFWEFCIDPHREGERRGWTHGFQGGVPIAVSASWNEQHDAYRDYLGDAWYQTEFSLPWGWQDKRISLHFGSVNYLADVWLNGAWLGQHEGGHLPFAFPADAHINGEQNRLVVRVNGELKPDRVPPGKIAATDEQLAHGDAMGASFDFFPFCGIQRPVWLLAQGSEALTDLTIVTEIDGSTGLVQVTAQHDCTQEAEVRFVLRYDGDTWLASAPALPGERAQVTLPVPDAHFWSPQSPTLYELTVELHRGAALLDCYTLPVGIRTVRVAGAALLLNGEPVTLRGFGRHEDFPVLGRGYVPAVVIKDTQLMQWVGANSFRTSHYPYAEPILDLADRLGILVIAETPAVGLFFQEQGLPRRMALWEQQTQELIARDKNHPSVILWSLANEPINTRPEAAQSFALLFEQARRLDPTRPVAFVGEHEISPEDDALALCDVLCLNRYDGWYFDTAQLEQGVQRLSDDLDTYHERYQKPILLTEFGADAIPGHHAHPPEMFSEEYQAQMILRFLDVLDSKPYVIGAHIWNLCDFKTGQGIRRPKALNHKGVFTRDRRPKLAAHRLRERWQPDAQ